VIMMGRLDDPPGLWVLGHRKPWRIMKRNLARRGRPGPAGS